MKLLGRNICLLILLAVALVACHDHHDDTKQDRKEMAILIYHPYVSDMTGVLASDYADILKSAKEHCGFPNLQLLHFSAPNPEKAYLIESSFDKNTLEVKNDTLKSYLFSETDYTRLDGLQRVMADVKSVLKSEKLGMVIGSHANGWIPVQKSMRRAFGSGSSDPKYKTNFTTLAEAITNNAMQMEFLVIDDCNSQNIENAYDLRNATKSVMSSATEIMMEGIPYKDSFHLLVDCDYEAFCDAFLGFYQTYSSPYATFSIVDCSKFDAMIDIMRVINSRYKLTDDSRAEIQPFGGTSMSDPSFYDFEDYVRRLCTDDEALLNEFSLRLADLVPLYYYTDNFWWSYTINGYRTHTIYPINTFCGITCSDPCIALHEQLKETAWYKATH